MNEQFRSTEEPQEENSHESELTIKNLVDAMIDHLNSEEILELEDIEDFETALGFVYTLLLEKGIEVEEVDQILRDANIIE